MVSPWTVVADPAERQATALCGRALGLEFCRQNGGVTTRNRAVAAITATTGSAAGAATAASTPDASEAPAAAGGSPRRARRVRRVVARMALLLVALVLVLVAGGAFYLWRLPSVSGAPALVAALAAAHHETLAPLPPPAKLGAAVVAVEDEHFYSNVFFEVAAGALRAGFAALRRGGDPGGSTIVQQLAKQLYPHGPGVGGTLREIGLGVKLALAYPKARLLDMYLNVVYFGNGYWGANAAAKGYFGVSPDRLTWAEASLLAGLVQAPSAYDPLVHPRLAKERQAHVLHQLVVNNDLSPVAARTAGHARLPLR